MTRNTLVRRAVVVVAVACVAFAGTAAAVSAVTGGGAGDAGDLGGAAAVDPGTVTAGTTTGNHRFTFTAEGVSKDGNSDTVHVSFPNALAEAGLSVNGVTVENVSDGSGISVASSPSLVDGPDGDGVRDTVRLAVSPTGGGAVDANVRLDVSTTAPSVTSERAYDVTANVTDSDGSTVGPTTFATLTVEPSGETTTDGDTATETETGGSDTETEMGGGDDGTDANELGTADDDLGSTDTESAGSGPGFTAVLAVLAVVGVALLAAHRD